MKFRKIGTSGIEASVIAVGAWAMGGWMWGGTNEKASIDTIHAALDEGVNFIDTAPIYGFGVSEEIVGKAIKDRRDKVVLATKCGMVCRTDAGEFKFNANTLGVDPDGIIPVRIYQGASSIRQEIEQSLRRLQTDYIDVYQPHWQDSTTPAAETMETLVKLKEEGKIRAIGLCNSTIDEISEFRKVGIIDSDQEKYSMLDRNLEKKQVPYCRENDISIFAYSPLANGLLTGKMGPEREFAPGDLRGGKPRFSVENRRKVGEMLAEIAPIADTHNISLVQLVTAWTIAQPGISHALCGMRNIEQARENAAAGRVELSTEELNRMRSVIDDYAETVV